MSARGWRTVGGLGVSLAIAWMAAAPFAWAQIGAGEITGVVMDQARAAVPGATVTLTSLATNRQVVVMTTAEGVYTAPGLAPGRYRLEVALSGFKPLQA